MNMSILLFIIELLPYSTPSVICIIAIFSIHFCSNVLFFIFNISNKTEAIERVREREFNSIWVVRNEPHSMNHRSIHYYMDVPVIVYVCICIYLIGILETALNFREYKNLAEPFIYYIFFVGSVHVSVLKAFFGFFLLGIAHTHK